MTKLPLSGDELFVDAETIEICEVHNFSLCEILMIDLFYFVLFYRLVMFGISSFLFLLLLELLSPLSAHPNTQAKGNKTRKLIFFVWHKSSIDIRNFWLKLNIWFCDAHPLSLNKTTDVDSTWHTRKRKGEVIENGLGWTFERCGQNQSTRGAKAIGWATHTCNFI